MPIRFGAEELYPRYNDGLDARTLDQLERSRASSVDQMARAGEMNAQGIASKWAGLSNLVDKGVSGYEHGQDQARKQALEGRTEEEHAAHMKAYQEASDTHLSQMDRDKKQNQLLGLQTEEARQHQDWLNSANPTTQRPHREDEYTMGEREFGLREKGVNAQIKSADTAAMAATDARKREKDQYDANIVAAKAHPVIAAGGNPDAVRADLQKQGFSDNAITLGLSAAGEKVATSKNAKAQEWFLKNPNAKQDIDQTAKDALALSSLVDDAKQYSAADPGGPTESAKRKLQGTLTKLGDSGKIDAEALEGGWLGAKLGVNTNFSPTLKTGMDRVSATLKGQRDQLASKIDGMKRLYGGAPDPTILQNIQQAESFLQSIDQRLQTLGQKNTVDIRNPLKGPGSVQLGPGGALPVNMQGPTGPMPAAPDPTSSYRQYKRTN